MANRTRAVDEARRTWHARRVAIGDELRARRLALGASQTDVAVAIDVSTSEVSRRERGDAPTMTVLGLAEHAAAVGLRLSITMHPTGAGVRDAAQLRYIDRFLQRISAAFAVQLEAPIPVAGDLRAVDVVLRGGSCWPSRRRTAIVG